MYWIYITFKLWSKFKSTLLIKWSLLAPSRGSYIDQLLIPSGGGGDSDKCAATFVLKYHEHFLTIFAPSGSIILL